MGAAASLSVKVSANVSDFEKQMASLERSFGKTGASLQSVGSRLTTAITLPLTAIGGAAVKAAIDFESSFAGVAKTVDGIATSGGALTAFGTELRQQFRDLAKTIPVSVNELSRIAETAGAMGIPKEKILDFTAVMAKLGATTNLTSDAAATSIGKIQNVYQSAGVDTDRFAAALVDLGNKGASTEADIVGFAQRMAGFGVQANITQAEVLGWSNAMASVGINAELGSTAWNKVVSNIGVAVDMGGAKLQAFAQVAGMTATQFAQLWKADASEALNRVVEGFGRIKSEGGNLSGVMADLGMKNTGMRMTFMNLASAGDMVRASLDTGKQAWQGNTAMQEEFQKRAATVASQLQVLWNKIYDVGISLGQTLIPAMMRLTPAVEGVLSGLVKLVSWFSQLPTGVQTAVIGVAAFAAAMGPVTYVVGTVMSAGGALLTLFRTIGATSLFAPIATGAASAASAVGGFAVAAMAIPGVQIAAGIAAIGAAFVLLVPQIRGAIEEMGVWGTVKQGAMGALLNMPVIGPLLGSPGGVSRPGKQSGGDIALPNEVKQMADAMQHQANLQKQLAQQYPELAKAMGIAGESAKTTKTHFQEHTVVTAEMAHANDLLAVAMGHARAEAQFVSQAEHARFVQMGKDLAAIPHNVPLLLPSTNLSGMVPTIAATSGNFSSASLPAASASGPGLFQSMFGTPAQLGQQLSSSILSAIQGGGSAWKAAFGTVGSGIGKHFADSISGMLGKAMASGTGFLSSGFGSLLGGAVQAFLPMIGTFLGPLISKIGGFFKNLFGGNQVKDLINDTFGSYDALREQLNGLGAAGDAMWIKLTQQTGKGDVSGAKTQIDAIQQALDAHKQKLDEIAVAADNAGAHESAAMTQAKIALDEITGKLTSLQQSIANEAPEEVMGVIEAQTRAQIAALEEQRTAAQTIVDQLNQQQINIPVHFTVDGLVLPDGTTAKPASTPTVPEPAGLASGGIVRARPGGTLVNVGEGGRDEAVIPLGRMACAGGGHSTIIIEVDGRVLAEVVAPHVPDVYRRYGLA